MIGIHLQTIFSFRAYHRLALATRWQCVGFVIYLMFLSLLVFFAFSNSYIRHNLPIFLKNFPQVTFEKGTLTAPRQTVYAPLPDSPFNIEFDATRKTPPTSQELIDRHALALVMGNAVYMPGSRNVQMRPLPNSLSFTTSPSFLEENKSLIASVLGATFFMSSLFLIPLALFFDFCIAAAIGLFFNLITRRHVPRAIILRWALFLLGPLTALWCIRLWYTIPLFTLAQFILCIIYMQQIFNLIPQEK